jgi:16S rRNA (guanine(527)-N(7))-methyltransferase RsmG
LIPSTEAFLSEIKSRQFDLNEKQVQKAAQFAHIMHRENELQNLTRITGVSEYVDGHLIDVLELLKLPTLGDKILDIGTGCGVPGLLAAALMFHVEQKKWFLTDSEASKAEYLLRAAEELALTGVSTSSRRVEEVIEECSPDTVIARAVGNVEKIAGWISNCSTWNNLILFKSRGWEDEWKAAQTTRFGKKLTVIHTHEYAVGDKYRVLVSLKRK